MPLTAAAQQTPAAGRPARLRGQAGPGHAAGDGLRPAARARRAAARGLAPGRALHRALLRSPGQRSVIEPQTYLYYIQLKTSQPSQGIWMPYDESTEKIIRDDFKRLLAHQLPRQPLDRHAADYTFPNGMIGKIVTYNMEERQRIKIGPTSRAARRSRLSKIDEKLKLSERRNPARHVHRSGAGPEGRRHRPRHDEGEGLPYAKVTHEIKEIAGRPEAGAPDLQHRRRAQGQDPEDRLRRQQGDQRRHAEAQMKENKEQWFLSFMQRPRHVSGNEVRRGRREDRRVLPGPRLHQGQRRRARSEGGRGFDGQEDAAGSSCGFRSPKGRATRSATFDFAGNTVVEDRGAASRSSRSKEGDYYSEKRPQGPREGARGVRRRRLLRVHRLPRLQVPRRAGSGRTAPTPEALQRRRRRRPARPARRSSTSRCGWSKGSSTSSTASRSSATRRRATTSSAARCGCSKTASSTPKR